MSLINDALKKAQKQRTGDTPPLASMPSIGGETATRIAKRAKPAGFNALLVRCALIGGGVIALLVAGYFVMRRSHRAPAVATAPAPAAAPAAGVPDSGQIPAAPKPASSAPAPLPASTSAVTFNLPRASPPATNSLPAAPTSAAGVAEPARPSAASAKEGSIPASTKPATSTPAIVKPAPAPAAKFDGKAVNYIETLRIAGIRASATDSKVLMNDRVYRVGDIVEHEMGLKLVGITSSSLTFENEAGAKYTRNF